MKATSSLELLKSHAIISRSWLIAQIDNPEPPKGFDLNLKVEENAERWMLNSPDVFCNTNDEEVLKQVLNEYDRTAKDFYRWKAEYTQEELLRFDIEKKVINTMRYFIIILRMCL